MPVRLVRLQRLDGALGAREVQCFGAILCWSRWRLWWFALVDREHTFEGLVSVLRGGRRGPESPAPTGWGRSAPRRAAVQAASAGGRLRPPPRRSRSGACQAGRRQAQGQDGAAVPGPERDVPNELRRPRAAPASVAELNHARARAGHRVHPRPHSTTGAPPPSAWPQRTRFLRALPRRRFDTAYVEDRRVHPRLPLVEWQGVAYSVRPEALGQRVTSASRSTRRSSRSTSALAVVGRHDLRRGATEPVWDPAHRAAAEAIALGRPRPQLTLITGNGDRPGGDLGTTRARRGRLRRRGSTWPLATAARLHGQLPMTDTVAPTSS